MKTKSIKRTTEITMETAEYIFAGKTPQQVLAWCAPCSAMVQMAKPEEAAALAGVDARTIYRWVEAEKIHYREMHAGLLLICLNSIESENRSARNGKHL